MWRKKAAVAQRDIDRALAELNLRIIHLRRLISSVEYQPMADMPELDIEAHGNDPDGLLRWFGGPWK